MAEPVPGKEELVARYKAVLRDIIERRPSGTRLKIAKALGTHKSFVSQVTNPAYPIPLPAAHVEPIFALCHVSEEERARFLTAYRAAHPNQSAQIGAGDGDGAAAKVLRIELPAFEDPARQKEVERTITEFAQRLIALSRDR